MSYVQKTLSEKREYLVLQVGECRAQIAQLEERGSAIQDEIAELQAAITDIDSVLAGLAMKDSALKSISIGGHLYPMLGPETEINFKDAEGRTVDVSYHGI